MEERNIDVETVRHYAKLAQLSFGEEEMGVMVRQFADILRYVDQISALDLGDVAATAQVLPMEGTMRSDEQRPSFSQERALMNAPDAESGHFLVPKVIDVKG